MSSVKDKELAKVFKQWTSVSKMLIDGKRNPKGVSKILQGIIRGTLEEKLLPIINLIKSSEEQIMAWQKANKKGKFGIPKKVFKGIPEPPELAEKDKKDGFVDVVLGGLPAPACADRQAGKDKESDMVLSGKIAWEYAVSQRETWKWDSVNFDDPSYLKPYENAQSRPQGFYWKKIQLGNVYQHQAVKKSKRNSPLN